MTHITVRPATPDDAQQVCNVINPLIEEGSTTAHRRIFDADRALSHYITPTDLISLFVAESESQIVGFQSLQWIDRADISDKTAEIGSFVAIGQHGRGIGHLLFSDSLEAARAADVAVMEATIRADNVPGLAYYSKIGFQDHLVHRQIPLSDGTLVDRVQKLFWLNK